MPVPEDHFTEEHETDSSDHDKELERVGNEEMNRADAKLRAEIANVVSSNKQLVKQIKTLTAKIDTLAAVDAMKPKVSEHKGVTVKDAATGKADLDAKEAKVEKLLKKAEAADKQNATGTAHEAKLGKTAMFCALITAGGPYMLQLFQLIKDAAAGKDITAAMGDAANAALIMGLVNQWRSETDQDYWNDFSTFFQTHAAIVDTAAGVGVKLTRPDPTSADLVVILHYSSILNPVPLSQSFVWNDAKEKADAVELVKKTYDPSTVSGKVNFIRGLANIKVRGMSVPRGVQANLGEIAVADYII